MIETAQGQSVHGTAFPNDKGRLNKDKLYTVRHSLMIQTAQGQSVLGTAFPNDTGRLNKQTVHGTAFTNYANRLYRNNVRILQHSRTMEAQKAEV